MDDMKWAWVLFVAATLAVLIRVAMWFLPSPTLRHSQEVAEAVEASAGMVAPEPAPGGEGEAGAVVEPVWPDEGEERGDWAPVAGSAEPLRLEPEPPPLASAPPPEEYYFRRTRWGMTREEVRVSEAGAPLRESERGLLYVVDTLELPSLLTYAFQGGGLVRARLAFSDPAGMEIPALSVAQAQRRFLFLREQLQSRYGEPIQKTAHLPRDVSDLRRRAQSQEEMARQYDVEIAEAERRLKEQREVLERRFEHWANRAEMVARGLAPLQRDLKDLRGWKQEMMEAATKSRQGIQERQQADHSRPLVATMVARWPFARGLQDVELRLDLRHALPRLEIRYERTQDVPDVWPGNDL